MNTHFKVAISSMKTESAFLKQYSEKFIDQSVQECKQANEQRKRLNEAIGYFMNFGKPKLERKNGS